MLRENARDLWLWLFDSRLGYFIIWHGMTAGRWSCAKLGRPLEPHRPCDWRDRPYYGKTRCPDCQTELVLDDSLKTAEWAMPRRFWWYDEWTCPACYFAQYEIAGRHPGVHMDWPEAVRDELFGRINELLTYHIGEDKQLHAVKNRLEEGAKLEIVSKDELRQNQQNQQGRKSANG